MPWARDRATAFPNVLVVITQGLGLQNGLLTFTELAAIPILALRSEEHTSELQSRPHLVCRLLLEKKKNKVLSKKVIIQPRGPLISTAGDPDIPDENELFADPSTNSYRSTDMVCVNRPMGRVHVWV